MTGLLRTCSRTALALLFAACCVAPCVAAESPPRGLWDGTIRVDSLSIAFPIEFSGDAAHLKAAFFNGTERIESTSGTLADDRLLLNFDHYATQLRATISDGVVTGTYGNDALYGQHAIELRPHRDSEATRERAPRVAGLWILPYESKKGEHAFRLIVRQRGSQVSAAILRVDGDTGQLQGRYRQDRFVLHHFDGARANVLEIVPLADDRLDVTLLGGKSPQKFVATRVQQARELGLPQPTPFNSHTTMKQPDEPLRFSFADLAGNQVAQSDARFAGKVLIVNVTGSWCPNCHDEAPFLVELYRRYRPLGLEIVAIDFEEAGEPRNRARVEAFIRTYGIEFTYLLGGGTDQVAQMLPQTNNLNAWPTTFFIGRNGKVHGIHAGFAALASGEFHRQVKREFIATLEKLLAE